MEKRDVQTGRELGAMNLQAACVRLGTQANAPALWSAG